MAALPLRMKKKIKLPTLTLLHLAYYLLSFLLLEN